MGNEYTSNAALLHVCLRDLHRVQPRLVCLNDQRDSEPFSTGNCFFFKWILVSKVPFDVCWQLRHEIKNAESITSKGEVMLIIGLEMVEIYGH